MRVYVTGADGMLGTALIAALRESPATADWPLLGVSLADFDIGDARAVRASVTGFRPDAVVHTAAHAIVDECEADPKLALRVSVAGVRNVADACREAGSRLVYISSDYVFDGADTPPGGYREGDMPNPLSVYGLTKLAGERIAGLLDRHLTVRTSWLFGGHDERVDTVLATVRQASRGERPRLIADQFSLLTYAADLAQALIFLLERPELAGTIHAANRGSASWFQVGTYLLSEMDGFCADNVGAEPVALAACAFLGERPRDSTLNTGRLAGLVCPRPVTSSCCGSPSTSRSGSTADRTGARRTPQPPRCSRRAIRNGPPSNGCGHSSTRAACSATTTSTGYSGPAPRPSRSAYTGAGCRPGVATDVRARALFLDFDGLICDTERAARRSWDELYRESGLAFPACLWERMVGRADGESVAVADLSRQFGAPVTDELRARRRHRKQALCETEPLRPGVAALIAAAARHGLTLAVVSSSPLSWVRGHLARLGVQDRFVMIVSGDAVARKKPAPDLYQVALLRTGLTATQAIAFEDSPTGVHAAKAARLRCVAVPNAAGGANDLSHADVVLGSLESYVLEADLLLMEGTPA